MQPITIIVIAITGIVCVGYLIDCIAFSFREEKRTHKKVNPGYYPFITKEQVN